MRILARTTICVIVNTISLIGFLCFIFIFGENVWQFGPSNELTVLHIKINTWEKYIIIIVISCVSKVLDVVVNDIASPNLAFTIYDSTKKVVYGFKKWHLHVLANWMWLINDTKKIVDTLILISRFDIAIITVVVSEIASIMVVSYLLSLKEKFIPDMDYPPEKRAFHNEEEEEELIN